MKPRTLKMTWILLISCVLLLTGQTPAMMARRATVDLEISVVDTDPAVLLDFIEYTITVTNHGPDTATGIEVETNLPEGLSFNAANSDPICSGNPLVTCTVGNLGGGASTNFVLAANTHAVKSVFNTFVVQTSDTDPTPGNDSVTVETTIQPPPAARIIEFAGQDWYVKQRDFFFGPGSNFWLDDEDSVWVDDAGKLHLKMRQCDIPNSAREWCTAEVVALNPSGYGNYQFFVDSPLNDLDPHVVVGLFLFHDTANEIDFEASTWNELSPVGNMQFVVQPHHLAGHRERFTSSFAGPTLHQFDWSAGAIDFSSIEGHDPGGTPIHTWTYNSGGIPTEDLNLRLRMNVWLFEADAPDNETEFEVVIADVVPPHRPTDLTALAVSDTQIDLSWSENATGEVGYSIERSAAGAGEWAGIDMTGVDTATYQDMGLACSTEFDYRVRADLGGGTFSSYSSIATAETQTCPPTAPNLIAPADGAEITERQPTFSWDDVPGASGYELELGRTTTPSTIDTQSPGSNSYTPAADLLTTTYFWRARSLYEAQSPSEWSDYFFVTILAPSGAEPDPYLYISTPTLQWSHITWATGYEIQVATDSKFQNIVAGDDTLDMNTLEYTPSPLSNGAYFWRARAKEAGGDWGNWSDVGTFVLAVP
jgi:uncharacterized repeat protein (TIGR01451 family)